MLLMPTFSLMRVTPPPPVANDALRKPGSIEQRLARHVARLFGVDDGDPAGCTWVCDFGAVSVGDLAAGALVARQSAPFTPRATYIVDRRVVRPGKQGEPGEAAPSNARTIPDLQELAPGSVNRFGPDTKAALVLVGADELFVQLEPSMNRVLELVGRSEDFARLGDASRLIAWAAIIVDLYRSQPALFVAAVKARSIQRALMADWSPRAFPHGEQAAAEIFPRSSDGSRGGQEKYRPTTLGVLDRVIRAGVAPRLPGMVAGADGEGSGPSAMFLCEDLVERWMRHLLYSADSGVSWIEGEGDFRRVETYVPRLALLSTFSAELAGQFWEVLPLGDGTGQWEVFDKELPEHAARMVPRIPSLSELSELDDAEGALAIRTILSLLRVLRESSAFTSKWLRDEVSQRCAALRDLSIAAFGPADATAVTVALHAALYQFEDKVNDTIGDGISTVRLHARMAWTAAHRSFQAGTIAPGDWIELVNRASPVLNNMADELANGGQNEVAIELRSEISEAWRGVLDQVGIPVPADETTLADTIRLAGLLHNYVGFMVRSPHTTERLQALAVGTGALLPARELVASSRRNDTALRTTLQVILRGEVLTARREDVDSEARASLVTSIGIHTRKLAATSMARGLILGVEAADRAAHFYCASCLLSATLFLDEHGQPSASISPSRLAVVTRSALLSMIQGTSITEASSNVNRIGEYFSDLARLARLQGIEITAREAPAWFESSIVSSVDKT